MYRLAFAFSTALMWWRLLCRQCIYNSNRIFEMEFWTHSVSEINVEGNKYPRPQYHQKIDTKDQSSSRNPNVFSYSSVFFSLHSTAFADSTKIMHQPIKCDSSLLTTCLFKKYICLVISSSPSSFSSAFCCYRMAATETKVFCAIASTVRYGNRAMSRMQSTHTRKQ